METKICKKCNIEKSLDEFVKYKGNITNNCILCNKEYMVSYYIKNKDKAKQKMKEYYMCNSETIYERNKQYKEKNKDKIKQYMASYYVENKDKAKQKIKNYYLKNTEYLKEYAKEYRKNNREKINNRHKKRMLNEPLYKMTTQIRKLILVSIKGYGYRKGSKTYDILGCSFDDFKLYIEKQFESWMTWDNWGTYTGNYNETWQIDHIIPLYESNTYEEIIKLNHYTNLRPLCSRKNIERLHNKNPNL